MRIVILLLLALISFFSNSCKEFENEEVFTNNSTLKKARNFNIEKKDSYTKISVKTPSLIKALR